MSDPPPTERPLAQIVAGEAPLVPFEVMDAPSMLSYDERALLRWAARAGGPAEGDIIDAGCFLGGSTLALGHGVLRRGQQGSGPKVHSFDLFRVGEERERVYFKPDFPFEVGASTLDVFHEITGSVREVVEVHAGDIADGPEWTEPISVLFVDVAKTWRTNDAILRRFFAALQPGSIVIQQDLVHFGHPWLAITMELLADHFELLGFVAFSSAVYRVRSPIAADELPIGMNARLSVDEMLELIGRCADRIGDPGAGYLRLAEAETLTCNNEIDRARDVLAAFEEDGRYEQLPWIDEHVAMCAERAAKQEARIRSGSDERLW